MIKKLMAILCAAAAMFTCLSCQPTPAEEIVVNRGDGALEQAVQDAQQAEAATPAGSAAAQPTPAPYAAPDAWTETLSLKWLDVVFPGVPIEINDAAAMPVYEMQAYRFPERAQAWRSALGYFLDGATGMREFVETKAYFAERMESVLRGYYDEEAGDYVPYGDEVLRAQMEQLQAMYDAAPEDAPFAPYALERIEAPFHMDFETPDGIMQAGVLDDTMVIRRGITRDEIIQLERWLWGGGARPGEAPQTAIEGVQITQEEAVAAGDEALRAMGLTGFTLASAERARALFRQDVTRKGYYLAYLRNPGGYVPVDYTVCSDFMLRLQGEEPAYAAVQGIESIAMFVDEEGVQYFQWGCPFEITQELTADVEILPFEQMQQIILQTLHNCLAWNGEEPEEDPYAILKEGANEYIVRRVALGSANVAPRDAEEGTLWNVPVWFVEFADEISYQAGDPTTMIAFNAVDGSIVDLGY